MNDINYEELLTTPCSQCGGKGVEIEMDNYYIGPDPMKELRVQIKKLEDEGASGEEDGELWELREMVAMAKAAGPPESRMLQVFRAVECVDCKRNMGIIGEHPTKLVFFCPLCNEKGRANRGENPHCETCKVDFKTN